MAAVESHILEHEEALEIEYEGVEVPQDLQEKADILVENYVAMLEEATGAYAQRSMADLEMGVPVLPGGYQYWNCITRGPFQWFGANPPQPAKILEAGRWSLLVAVIWINPAPSPGGGLPGTTVLADRDYRARIETINLSQVAQGPSHTWSQTFPAPAPITTTLRYWFIPPDPGLNPRLMEMNFTADVTLPGQPFAAFSTWHFDPVREPAFLRPEAPPHWQFERPVRFLVYRR